MLASAGVAVASSPSGSWPLLQEQGLATSRRGKLHLDTTRLPAGPLVFDVTTLCERVVEALAAGTRLVELDPSTASDWGYRGPAIPPQGTKPGERQPGATAPRDVGGGVDEPSPPRDGAAS